MIISFLHKGLERFYRTGKTSGIQAQHAFKLENVLFTLNRARHPADMDVPGYKLHPLKGTRKGIWSVTISANWRVTFRFTGSDV
nr:type II toxin-antitoxin system RelE/ParE family toxin [Endozoicomonas sp.]